MEKRPLRKAVDLKITSLDQLFNHVKVWQDICKSARFGIEKRYEKIYERKIPYSSVHFLDFIYVMREFDLAKSIFGTPRYAEFEGVSQTLWKSLILKGGESVESQIEHIKAYHFFFEDLVNSTDPEIKKAADTRLEFLKSQESGGDYINSNLADKEDQAFNVLRFKRVLLLRKQIFLEKLNSGYWSAFDTENGQLEFDNTIANISFPGKEKNKTIARELIEFVSLNKDYAYFLLADFFKQAKEEVLKGKRPIRKSRGSFDEYKELHNTLLHVNKEIDLTTKGLTYDNIEKRKEEYDKNIRTRELLTWALTEKSKELSFKDKVVSGIHEFSIDRKEIMTSVGMMFYSNSGKRIALGLLAEIQGDETPQWKEILDELSVDILVGVGSALTSAIMGPLFGNFVGSIISSSLKTLPPDPYMTEFKEIRKALDKIDKKIDDLEKNLTSLILKLPAQIKEKLEKDRFEARLLEFRNNLKKVETDANALIKGTKNSVDETYLSTLNENLILEIQFFITLLWNTEFKVPVVKKEEEITEVIRNFKMTPNTIFYNMIALEPSQRFHSSVGYIFDMVALVENAISHYQDVLPKLKETIAITLTTLDVCDRKEHLLAALLDIQRNEVLNNVLFNSVTTEMRYSIGLQNANLFAKMNTYWQAPDKFNLFSSFCLRQVGDLNKTIAPADSKTRFLTYDNSSKKWNDFPRSPRLFILPDGKQANEPYKVISNGKWYSYKPGQLEIMLGVKDTLLLKMPDGGIIRARAEFVEDFLKESLECKVKNGYCEKFGKDRDHVVIKENDVNIVFYKNGSNGGLKVVNTGGQPNEIVLKEWDFSHVDFERIYCMANIDYLGVFQIGFGIKGYDPKFPDKIMPRELLRFESTMITNQAPEYGTFDYLIPISEQKDLPISSVYFDNLRLLVPKSSLLAGQSLKRGSGLFFWPGRGCLIYQLDGNVVNYNPWESKDRKVHWASNTHGKANTHFVINKDGQNIQLFNDKKPVWSFNSHHKFYDDYHQTESELNKDNKVVEIIHGGSVIGIDKDGDLRKIGAFVSGFVKG